MVKREGWRNVCEITQVKCLGRTQTLSTQYLSNFILYGKSSALSSESLLLKVVMTPGIYLWEFLLLDYMRLQEATFYARSDCLESLPLLVYGIDGERIWCGST